MKPKYRYNHATKKCDALVSFPNETVIFTGFINPDTNIPHSFTMPSGPTATALGEMYLDIQKNR